MVKAIGLAVAGCLLALPVAAQSFSIQGKWKGTVAGYPDYVGGVMVDAERRTIWVDDIGRSSRGYVAHLDNTKVKFITTGIGLVAHIDCVIQSSDLLHCNGRYTDGRVFGAPFVLTRVGTAPRNLTTMHR